MFIQTKKLKSICKKYKNKIFRAQQIHTYIVIKKISIIVLLLQEASFQYWPNKHYTLQLDYFLTEITSEESVDSNIIKRVVKITHKETVS